MTSIPSRGQVEPLAALVSVAAVCVALSVYAGVVADSFDESDTDRSVADPALDSAWVSLNDNGVISPDRTPFATAIDSSSLPQGRYVHISVTVVDDSGALQTVDSVTVTPQRTVESHENSQPPDTATSAQRPVPVRLEAGDIRPGRLTVVVWQ